MTAVSKNNPSRVPKPVDERFWAAVDKTGDCWTWVHYRNRKGYGSFSISPGRAALAHRYAWELTNGPIPDGLVVCHACDNPPCVRPAHLFLGTQAANVRDCQAKGRFLTQRRIQAVPQGEDHYLRRNPSRIRRGDQIGTSKLTWEQVREIRRLRAGGDITLQQLADRFGVGLSNVSLIVLNKTWIESDDNRATGCPQ